MNQGSLTPSIQQNNSRQLSRQSHIFVLISALLSTLQRVVFLFVGLTRVTIL